jgi:rare lipoprotein A
MDTRNGLRWAAIAVILVASSACTLVGYPAGEPGGVPSPATPRARDAPVAGAGRASDGGRVYEVFGERYRVLDSAEGYRERGLASWYGPGFDGRPTSSGEVFDMNRPSAAHRTLPLHTWVEVTNLENGRRMVLRVNDRGPFADTDRRIIDLSRAAALELDVVGPGTARVEVRALSSDELGWR